MNTTLTFAWTAYVAARGNARHASLMVKRFATSPPLNAIAAGLLVSGFGLRVPPGAADPVAAIGAATGILMAIGVGIRFQPPGAGLDKAALIHTARLTSALGVALRSEPHPDDGAAQRDLLVPRRGQGAEQPGRLAEHTAHLGTAVGLVPLSQGPVAHLLNPNRACEPGERRRGRVLHVG